MIKNVQAAASVCRRLDVAGTRVYYSNAAAIALAIADISSGSKLR